MAMNLSSSEMHAEFLDIWNLKKAAPFDEAVLFDLEKYLTESFSTANSDAWQLMPKHMFLLREATTCLLLFTKFVGEPKMNTQSAAFLSQVHRSVNCLIAIRLLLANGLEETCRPTTRNYLEALDVSIACLIDQEFSLQFFGDDQIDFDALWNRSIGYGKVYKYLRTACQIAGLSEEEIEEHIQRRKALKTNLSSSVHGDASGAFRSMVPPLLGYPDMVSTEPHGVISIHTANHAAAVINETLQYLSIVVKILLSEKAPEAFDLQRKGKKAHTFFTQFFAFQEIYNRHDLPDGDEIRSPDCSAAQG
ncbi:MAG TPA: hypothetical protein VLO13_03225 [Halomonas sp.]|nr:hypothetical protein [Halomonas sp.]